MYDHNFAGVNHDRPIARDTEGVLIHTGMRVKDVRDRGEGEVWNVDGNRVFMHDPDNFGSYWDADAKYLRVIRR